MIKPMLAELQDKPFNDPGYIWENKYDGIRCVATVTPNGAKLQARSGTNKTELFPELEFSTKSSAVLDGEIIAGSGFNGIQHRANRSNGIALAAKQYPARYIVFDVLSVSNTDIRQAPLSKRKEVLNAVLVPTPTVQIAPVYPDGVALFEQVVQAEGEGVIGKRLDMPYYEDRRAWIKVKRAQQGHFFVVGYTAGTGWRASTFGALQLAELSEGRLRYVGSVGTGFKNKDIDTIFARLRFLSSFVSSLEIVFAVDEPTTWVKSEMIVKVAFLERTGDGKLRFPSFKGVVA